MSPFQPESHPGEALFDAAFGERWPDAGIRPEEPGDQTFLRALFLESSPLAGLLPDAMLEDQARIRMASLGAECPGAMRRIIEIDGVPAGRLMIDWNRDGKSHCADIAVSLHAQGRGLGAAMLQAWIAASAELGLACSLEVDAANSAREIYRKLGFTELAGEYEGLPQIAMIRPV